MAPETLYAARHTPSSPTPSSTLRTERKTQTYNTLQRLAFIRHDPFLRRRKPDRSRSRARRKQRQRKKRSHVEVVTLRFETIKKIWQDGNTHTD
jgi:hypothetical protein